MATVALHQWTIPSPRGLWYRGIVRIDHLLFLTSEVDYTTMEAIQGAVPGDPKDLVTTLMGHGRFNRPVTVKIADITGLDRDATKGLLTIRTDEESYEMRVPNRDRLDEVARLIAKTIKQHTAAAS